MTRDTTVSAKPAVDPTASIHDAEIGHGNSPAAWTAVLVMLAGAALSSFAFIIASELLFWAGIAVMFLGLLAGWIMKRAGYGVDGHKLKNNGH